MVDYASEDSKRSEPPTYPDAVIAAVGKGRTAQEYASAIARDRDFLKAIERGIEASIQADRLRLKCPDWNQQIRIAIQNLLVPVRDEITLGE